jgi:hypothetical protein
MADIVGHKTGDRILGTPRKRVVEQTAAVHCAAEDMIDALTSQQVDAMGPLEVLMRIMRRALLKSDLSNAIKIATDLMPYHYAKKTAVKEHDPDALRPETIADDPDPKVKD